jgi:hypothetical protein
MADVGELSAEQRLEQLEYMLGAGSYAPQPGDDTKDPIELLAGFRRERREITGRLDEDPPKAERVRLEHRLRLAIAGAHANATFQDPEEQLVALAVERQIAQGQIMLADKADDPRFVGDFVSNSERARQASERLPQIEAEIQRVEAALAAALAAA